jgi:uncharacterized protein (DUF58 family)
LSITKEAAMLWSLAIILLLLWTLGLATSFMLGGYLHMLVAAATLLLLAQIIRTRAGRASAPSRSPGHAGDGR